MLTAAIIAGCAIGWRIVFREVWRNLLDPYERETWGPFIMSFLCAVVFCWAAPAVLLLNFLSHRAGGVRALGDRLAGKPRAERKQEKIAALEAENARLERELGIAAESNPSVVGNPLYGPIVIGKSWDAQWETLQPQRP